VASWKKRQALYDEALSNGDDVREEQDGYPKKRAGSAVIGLLAKL
jgi:hypothetical protein